MAKNEKVENTETTAKPQQQLYVGVNFTVPGAKSETRIEPGLIEVGTLPVALEQKLRSRGQLTDVR